MSKPTKTNVPGLGVRRIAALDEPAAAGGSKVIKLEEAGPNLSAADLTCPL